MLLATPIRYLSHMTRQATFEVGSRGKYGANDKFNPMEMCVF
jgi:hypothetical protein